MPRFFYTRMSINNRFLTNMLRSVSSHNTRLAEQETMVSLCCSLYGFVIYEFAVWICVVCWKVVDAA